LQIVCSQLRKDSPASGAWDEQRTCAPFEPK
jgi:hypothetical protein